MSAPEHSQSSSSSDVNSQSGLPAISPDVVEQEEGSEFDDIIPSQAFDTLPVVGLGGSAGSIQALRQFFEAMPDGSGMAFVVVLHLAPENASIMDDILGRTTQMPVVQAVDGQKLEANHVYVIPPGKLLSAQNGNLCLTPIEAERGKRTTVDLFFRTLADTHGPNASAIILSGADGDGALGIKRIKERGGLTVAQDPAEAEHPSMPRSAIDTGMVDWVLPVEQMPERLLLYRADGKRLQLPPEEGPQPATETISVPDADEAALREVLTHLRSRTGRDFSYYKRATVVRRVARRMQVNSVATMQEYLLFLRTHPGEVGALQEDLLISVTNFFRDRACFEALEAQIPLLFHGKKSSDVIRVWTAGCATGEEAYSIAMLLLEEAGRLDEPPAIQIFATDLAEDVIAVARDGLYPFTITADVSEDRLRRFFVKEHRGYRARRELRECVLFAVHDLLKDAPFSRLDMFSCRNLLIYLSNEAQKRAFEIAHFAVKPEGWLFIGTSENVDDEGAMWRPVDKKHRIYRQRPAVRTGMLSSISPATFGRPSTLDRAKSGPLVHGPAFSAASPAMLQRDADLHEDRRVSWEEVHFKLIERFAPPSLIVTQDHDIVHMSENAGQFLHFTGGEPSMNLMKIVHPMLRVELRAALFRTAQTSLPVEVFRVPLELDGKSVAVDIRVAPAQEIAPDYLLVVFAVREQADSEAAQARQEAEPAVRHLEREIEQMKTRLRNTIEQYEVSCEELKASNEELQAMNEELRSSAEELETSREELQSVNEELTTVNQELKSKVDDLGHSNSDLANLMAATGVATIFLDRQLAITRYTPSAVTLFRLIASDVGRPLTDLNHQLNYPELKDDAERILKTLIPVKREVNDGEGHWYLAQLLPYRTAEDRIAGVVLTFVDITETRHAEQARADLAEKLARHSRLFDIALSSIADFAYTFDREGRFTFANRPLCELLGRSLEEMIGCNFHDLGYPPELATKLQAEIEEVFTTAQNRMGETPFIDRHGEEGYYEYIFQPIVGADGSVEQVAGSTRVITERRRTEAALRESEIRFRQFAENSTDVLWISVADGSGLEYLSPAFDQIWGESRDGVMKDIGRWLEMLHPEDHERVLGFMPRLLAGETVMEEYRIIRPLDGGLRWIRDTGFPIRDETGAIRRLAGIAQDITETKAAERALAQSEERLRLIVENAREYAIFSLDLERHITSWNSGAQRILGYSQEEALGQLGDIIFTPEDCAACAAEQEAEGARANGSATDERWHVRKDGSRFWGSGVMMAMHDERGEAIGFVKIFRDQTEAREAQLTLEQSQRDLWEALQEMESARREAEAATRAKDQFLAVLSHELRTPLTPVLMAVSSLSRRKDMPPNAQEALAMIRRNVEIEAHFIDDLLDVTRLTHGKLELVCIPMDANEAMQRAIDISRPDIEAKGQQLTVSLEATERQIDGDIHRLQQVFWNLLKNASKFTPEGGQIWLTTGNAGGCFVAEVRDTGIGFEPEAGERIFTPFEQASRAVTREFGGLGLGLAISKAAVDAHHGTLKAESAGPNCGATFRVELPLLGAGAEE